jgi:hypothetical protein
MSEMRQAVGVVNWGCNIKCVHKIKLKTQTITGYNRR